MSHPDGSRIAHGRPGYGRDVIHVGTSGWQYRDWRGVLYPERLPQERWLERYAEAFSVVEVNNSFYRLPERSTFERWRDRTPPGFTFVVKASRYLTHVKRLADAEDGVRRFGERIEGLGAKLGPVLFQLPPRFHVDVPRLRAFLDRLPPGLHGAWEFRDPSWMTDEVLELLDRAGAAFVLADRPGFRGPLLVTGGWSYVRFHQGSRHGADYRRDKLRRWAERILELPATDVWVFFNNDTGGAAVRDARFLREALEQVRARVA
jgi:uncharacterized protein YecE (DUF72 family)